MKNLKIKDCPLCGEIIWKFKRPSLNITKSSISFNFKPIPYAMNEKGTTFFVLLTDGSRMEIAICKSCLEKITDDDVKKIYSDIVFTKLEMIKKDRRKDLHYRLFERIRSVEIYKWAKDEKTLIDYLGIKNTTEKVNA